MRLHELTSPIAGRITTTRSRRPDSGARPGGQTPNGQHQLRDPTLAPEEVLFARKNAPQRYAEKDIYFAHEALPDGGRDILPDSDMLKAVHGYTSQFYEAMGERHAANGTARGRRSRDAGDGDSGGNPCFVGSRHVDERSMDETALLAFGMLLEEAARETLGKRGDLVFTEGLDDGDDAEEEVGASDTTHVRRGEVTVGFEGKEEFWKRRLPKRRKIKNDNA